MAPATCLFPQASSVGVFIDQDIKITNQLFYFFFKKNKISRFYDYLKLTRGEKFKSAEMSMEKKMYKNNG